MDPGELNAMNNCAHCNGELATLTSEVDVRFIALIILFERNLAPCLLLPESMGSVPTFGFEFVRVLGSQMFHFIQPLLCMCFFSLSSGLHVHVFHGSLKF